MAGETVETVRHAEVAIANRSQRGDEMTTSAQNQ
jgi:hypothetical protein